MSRYMMADPAYDKVLARMAKKGGISIHPSGRIYAGALEKGENMDIFNGRDPIAHVNPAHLRLYARSRDADQKRHALSSPSIPGHWAVRDPVTGERIHAPVQLYKNALTARRKFEDWYNPSKEGEVRAALLGAIPRDDVNILRDVLLYKEWLGRDMQEFYLHVTGKAIPTPSHHQRVADEIPKQMFTEDLARNQVPRDMEVEPRTIQIDCMRQAALFHTNYQDQVETRYDIDARQRQNALKDYDRLVEEKYARALGSIPISSMQIGNPETISGVSNGGYHSETKMVHEMREAVTLFEEAHRTRITHISAHPDLWDAFRLNTWSRLDNPNMHPAGLMTGGGMTPMIGFNNVTAVSSTFLPNNEFVFTSHQFAVIHGYGGETSYTFFNFPREVTQTVMNVYIDIFGTYKQVPWKDNSTTGEEGRGYGFKGPVAS